MAASILFLVIGSIAVGVFALGYWIGARSFESNTAKVVAGILCGLGAVAIAVGILFAGCMAIVGQNGFH